MAAIALGTVLLILSGLHVFWALGGSLGKGVAIPEIGGRPVFVPSRTATLLVAFALLGAAFIALVQGRVLPSQHPLLPARWIAFGIGGLFVLRAIGEFRLVGFFKRVRGTSFARWDSLLFSPLCLLIGGGFLWLARG